MIILRIKAQYAAAKDCEPRGLQNSGVKIFSPGRERPVLLPTADIALIVTC
jgi:hypothetical protein